MAKPAGVVKFGTAVCAEHARTPYEGIRRDGRNVPGIGI